jgi:alpha-L-fucosidase
MLRCFRFDRVAIFVVGLTMAGIVGSNRLTQADDDPLATPTEFASLISANTEPMQTGKFEPNWQSLAQYEAPDWFRDAKFGIWAHWGAQCEPEDGDWYARDMYIEGSPKNKFHAEHYGPPSEVGFKDIIHMWKAENFDPEKLMALYKRAGAQYFVALANHHDNFDNFDSKYQPWNSVRLGPQRDLIGDWAKAARNNGLKFGVSIHAAHAWMWYEPAQGADKKGPLADVPYDGKLTKADGVGKWWEGLDPQDLYAQNHARSQSDNTGRNWRWGNGCSTPDVAYCDKFYNRTIDLINKYQPDLVYFDDSFLPLYPVSDAGLKIAAHFYNSNMKLHDGKLEAVMECKELKPEQRKTMVWDIERGQANEIEPQAWQTDTCIGGWHYNRALFEQHKYKSAKTVIQMLVDNVSKNGNLLLSVPVRADGTIDDDEVKIVEGIAKWMDVNKEAIFGTRPWKVFGEGPAAEAANPLRAQGFNEGKGKPLSAADFRFTTKGDTLYAIETGVPKEAIKIKSLGTDTKLLDKPIGEVQLLGSDETLKWTQDADGLAINVPEKVATPEALVYKITPAK